MVQVSVLMTFLYIGYKWLLSGRTFHAFNRTILLIIIAAAWLIPAFIPMLKPRPIIDTEAGLPIMISATDSPSQTTTSSPLLNWQLLLIAAYITGVTVSIAFTLRGAWRIYRIYATGLREYEHKYIKIINCHAPGPFSWGKYIFLRPADCNEDMPLVIRHELSHLTHRHWIDLILTQLNIILQWYSPAAYLIMHEIKCVHEFQADQDVAIHDPRSYQLMLLKKTVGTSFPTFANSLNHSQIKLRITMMLKHNSSAVERLAALALPAMATIGIFTISMPSVAHTLNDLENATTGIFGNKSNNSSASGQDESVEAHEITAISQESASHDEDNPPLTTSSPLFTPQTDEERTHLNDKMQSLTIFVNGELFTGDLNDIDPATIKDMKVIKNDPQYPNGTILINLKDESEYTAIAVEKIAEFKGGNAALLNFLSQNIVVPQDVPLDKAKRVIVQFTIGIDGNVTNARVLRRADSRLDNEALRVVSLTSGMWIPAENNGQPISSKFVLPFNFKKN